MKAKDGRDASREHDDVPFGTRLRRLREAAGLTQEELAEKADLSAKGISDLERGQRRRPYPHTVRSLADALKLPEDERAALIATVPKRGSPRIGALMGAVPEPEHAPPVPSTSLVGRERNLGEVGDLILRPEVRLLTLTGTGGVGKTRLALEAVKEAAGLFPDGTAFVALAPLSYAELVIPTVVRSLGLREGQNLRDQAPREVLRTHLRDKKLLLVLDNFEHVLEAAPEVAELVEVCPNLCVLVTSRAPLRVRGEQEYSVPPLALPTSTRSPEKIEEVSGSASGRLFVERAKEASHAFELTAENAGAVASICRRLAGLPLALELAAAKTTFLDPATMLSRLDQALSTGWARDLPERQRTMRASLDWSHDLLDAAQQELFCRLSVFSGGFTLEAAEVVGADGQVGSGEVLDLLGQLVEQSLVVRASTEGLSRYGMLEPVRQYALERLGEGGEAEEVRRRHAEFFLALAERAEPEIKGHDQVEWLDRLEVENDNLSAAIGWSLEAGDAPMAARFGWALGMYWVMRTRHREGRLWMEQALAKTALSAKLRGRALWALAVCVYGSGDNQRVKTVAEEGVALSRQAKDRVGEARTLGALGFAALMLAELDRAARILEESLKIFRELGDEWGSAHILTHLVIVPLRRGDYPQAAGYAEEALSLSRRTGDGFAANISLNLLAQAAWASGEHRRADRYLREALAIAHEMRDRMDAAYCMHGLAALAGERGEQQRAARMLGAAEALLETAGTPFRALDDHELHQRAVSGVRQQLEERVWRTAWGKGRAMTFDDAVAYALEETSRLAPPTIVP